MVDVMIWYCQNNTAASLSNSKKSYCWVISLLRGTEFAVVNIWQNKLIEEDKMERMEGCSVTKMLSRVLSGFLGKAIESTQLLLIKVFAEI